MPEGTKYDVIIIGAGPTGLTVGLYCGRAKVKTLIRDKFFAGGTLLKTQKIKIIPASKKLRSRILQNEKLNRIILWVATILVVAFIFSPNIVGLFVT